MSRFDTLKSVTKSVTENLENLPVFYWLVPKLELEWISDPDDYEEWQRDPDFLWRGYSVSKTVYSKKSVNLQPAPQQTPEQYPRLVRSEVFPTANKLNDPSLALKGGTVFENVATLIDDPYQYVFLDDKASGYLDDVEGDVEVKSLKREQVKALAERFGILLHPRFGDSLYAWTRAALTFRRLTALQNLLNLPRAEKSELIDPATYEPTAKRFDHYEQQSRSKFACEGVEFPLYTLASPCLFPFDLDETGFANSPRLLTKRQLRRKIRKWLTEEINESLDRYGQSETYFYMDATPGMLAVAEQRGFDLEEGDSMPYFGLKAGLYAYALFEFYQSFRKGAEVRACQGCGSLFLPKRKNARYCGVRSGRCRKKAQRRREAEK